MSNKLKYLKYFLTGILIFLLLSPQIASADFLGIVDLVESGLEGVEEVVQPILFQAIRFLFLYAIGIIALSTSTSLLQHVISHPEWLSLHQDRSTLVWSGFQFTSGLANMLLILIFIFSAFCIILRIETFPAKKVLIKVIVVGLLLNFCLVFIGILIDISNALYGTILEKLTVQPGETPPGQPDQTGSSLLTITMEKLIGPVWQQFILMAAWYGTLAGSFAIPGISLASQLGIALGFQAIFLPNLIIWILQLVCVFLLVGTLFLYIFLFVIRIFIIQILAILSPLAFLCFILPQTEKYWKEWLQHLLEWTFLGIFLLFFLVLGLRAIDTILPPGAGILSTTAPLPFLAWFRIKEYFIYYFFLFIYLLVILWFTNRFKPVLATTLIAGATAWGSWIWTKTLKPAGRAVWETGKKSFLESESPRVQRMRQRMERWATAPLPELKGWRALGAPAVIPAWALRRTMARQLSLVPLEETKKAIREGEKRAEEIAEPKLLLSEIRGAIAARNYGKAIGLLSKSIEKGGGFKKIIETEFEAENAILLAQRANRIGAIKEAERIARSSLKAETLRQHPNLLKEMGFKEFADLTPEEQREWQMKGYRTALDKLIDETRGDKIKDLAKGFMNVREVRRGVIKFWRGSQLAKAAEEHGRDFVEPYMERINRLIQGYITRFGRERGMEAFVKRYPHISLYLTSTTAYDLGYRTPADLTRAEVRRILRR